MNVVPIKRQKAVLMEFCKIILLDLVFSINTLKFQGTLHSLISCDLEFSEFIIIFPHLETDFNYPKCKLYVFLPQSLTHKHKDCAHTYTQKINMSV